MPRRTPRWSVRKGDIAVDPDTGWRKWHYQFTANDTHDWDATGDVVLVDCGLDSLANCCCRPTATACFTFWTGSPGRSCPPPFVRTNWVSSWDSAGRPITTPGWRATPDGSTVYPALVGGSNFQAPSYSRQDGLDVFRIL